MVIEKFLAILLHQSLALMFALTRFLAKAMIFQARLFVNRVKLLFLLRKLLPKGKVLLRFVGIEEKDSHLEDDPGNKSLNSRPHEAKRRPRNAAAASWRPSLVANL